MFSGKTLLITGGTGSFGNAVLKRFLTTNIKEIRIFSRDEKKQDDMRKQYKDDKIKFYIGDVRDFNSIAGAMHGVDYVFSAAALKQVPSCEFFPMEAVRCEKSYLPFDGQGCIPNQLDGYLQSHDGNDHGSQVENGNGG